MIEYIDRDKVLELLAEGHGNRTDEQEVTILEAYDRIKKIAAVDIVKIYHSEIVEKENEVYREALKKWGDVLQTVVALEEMAELQKELSKNLRGSNNVDAIAEEIADVEIMLAQMKLLHNCRTMVETVKAAKIKRLAERLVKDNG